ncbi:uncharacterized protein LOC102151918 isoform X9 [Canis lupus familiaris]|uniref:uncharacterized protein LOC102151918 isoform X9 n=1 Tax=Canis lupus familiaris TaxID=9615 RepID=UPI0015F125CA|nr:uncharacterized protein LOC102151918 isoform X9 [Canis lupus familiaris]XP_038534559.1 uncharacterized protein LOC102151918 isoform X9 [Canis lupus familiaris]
MRKKLRLRDILPRWCGEGKSPRQDCSEKAPGEQGTQPGCLLLRSNTGRDRIHHFLILSGSYLRLTQDDDLTDLTERVLRDWTLPRGRNQSIYFTSEERVWQEAFKLDFSPYSSWISVPCAVNNLFNGTLQPSSLAWTTPDTLKGHGEGPTLSEAELLGTGGLLAPKPDGSSLDMDSESQDVKTSFLPIQGSCPRAPRWEPRFLRLLWASDSSSSLPWRRPLSSCAPFPAYPHPLYGDRREDIVG